MFKAIVCNFCRGPRGILSNYNNTVGASTGGTLLLIAHQLYPFCCTSRFFLTNTINNFNISWALF